MNISKIKTCKATLNIESLGTSVEKDVITMILSNCISKESIEAEIMFFTAFKFVNNEGKFRNPKLALKFKATFTDSADISDFLHSSYTYLRGVVLPGSTNVGRKVFKEQVESKVEKHVDSSSSKLTYMYNESSVPGFIKTETEIKDKNDQLNMITRDLPYLIYNLSKWGSLDKNPTNVTITLKDDEFKKIYLTVSENSSEDRKTPYSTRVVVEFKEPYFNNYRKMISKNGSTGENDSIFDDINSAIGINEDTFYNLQADNSAWLSIKEIE